MIPPALRQPAPLDPEAVLYDAWRFFDWRPGDYDPAPRFAVIVRCQDGEATRLEFRHGSHAATLTLALRRAGHDAELREIMPRPRKPEPIPEPGSGPLLTGYPAAVEMHPGQVWEFTCHCPGLLTIGVPPICAHCKAPLRSQERLP
jgi:hypothetical protein